jgi:predicted metal-dependent enzyme (double-stranded beta helix superfamily)
MTGEELKMSYTLDQFSADCRDALQTDSGPGGREQVRLCVERALKDEEFVTTHLKEDAAQQREVLYEDPDLGFCICAHVYNGAKQGEPHDHGPTWAIYGQAVGETEMTDWEIISAPDGDNPGKVEKVKSYRMGPGDAHVYEVGDVHAPLRNGPTRLIRIEGQNTDHIKRTPLEAA